MRKSRDIIRLRRWCIRRREEGTPVGEICAAAQIPRRTLYNWLNQYRHSGLEGLEPASRRPHTESWRK
ncbi:helix-turn-helix domain-containing protein [Candidatus Bathyarchaeota archaeon]|nr:helix-turn-helix domain-containing protein [Candidatus Bathyarchaeota archaeon]